MDEPTAMGASSSAARRTRAEHTVGAGGAPACPGRTWTLVLLLITLLTGAPLHAQLFGQWWWDGSVGLAQGRTENRRGGQELSDFRSDSLATSLGVNGYLLHPALGRFRLGVDLALSEFEGGRSLESEQTGLSGYLTLFPRGAYPLRLSYRRQLYDTTLADDEDPIDVLGTVEESEQWSGRLRIRRGALRGTLVGLSSTSFGFLDMEAREDSNESEFVSWSRSAGSVESHLRVEHQMRRYGRVDLAFEDLTLNLQQSGSFMQEWNWRITGVGIQRETEVSDEPARTTDDYRMRTRLFRTVRDTDQLDLTSHFGLSRPQGVPSVDSVGWSLFYRWRPRAKVEVSPFVQYARRTGGPREVESPRAGAAVSWRRDGGSIDWLVGGRFSVGELQSIDGEVTENQSRSGFSMNASMGHGEVKGLRKELEIEAGRNELRSNRAVLTDFPDLGLPGTVLGDENYSRLRGSLSHRWDSKWISAWGEASRRESSSGSPGEGFESDTSTVNVQFAARQLRLQASGGRSHVTQDAQTQETRFVGGHASWRPWRQLSIKGSFRRDTREFALAPDTDGERLELSVVFRFGLFDLRAGAFETTERLDGGSERTNQGMSWSISRRLAGWLPIVTGTQRRGTIR